MSALTFKKTLSILLSLCILSGITVTSAKTNNAPGFEYTNNEINNNKSSGRARFGNYPGQIQDEMLNFIDSVFGNTHGVYFEDFFNYPGIFR